MATGVVGTSGANARKTVDLVTKHEVGFVTTQCRLMVEKIALLTVRVTQNL